jgi:hypothetical protein
VGDSPSQFGNGGRGVVSTPEVGYFQVEVDKIRLSNGDVRPETTWTTHQN